MPTALFSNPALKPTRILRSAYLARYARSFHLTAEAQIMKFGDHLVSPRIGYSHHGIYIGDDQVIHYSGFANGISSGEIEISSLDEFSRGNLSS